MPFADERLEPEFKEPYEAWKAKPSPATNAALLDTLHPLITQATQMHAGNTNPLILSRARKMTLGAMKTYDPTKARIRTHLFNQLQGLKRVGRQQSQVLSVPERIQLDRHHLDLYTQELTDKLGREPNDSELAEHSGFSPRRFARIRSYNPAVAEGTLEATNPEGEVFGGQIDPNKQSNDIWQQIVYDEATPMDKTIMEHSLGLNGKRRLANHQIASKIGRSPGLVSQRKLLLQEKLNRGADMEGMF
jgi:hypothetical protein